MKLLIVLTLSVLMLSCVSQPVKSTLGLSCVPCTKLKPIYLPAVVDEQLENDVTDYNIAYDAVCDIFGLKE